MGFILGVALFVGGIAIAYNFAGWLGVVGVLALWVWIGKKLDPILWGR